MNADILLILEWAGRAAGGLVVLALVVAAGATLYRTAVPLDHGMQRESFYLTMRDGVKLAVDLYLPKGRQTGAQLPAIVQQTRYWRATAFRWPFRLFLSPTGDGYDGLGLRKGFISHGYAWVGVDVRGTGASYGFQDGIYPGASIADTHEIVNWIVGQPWSNGKVGLYGISYDATCAEMGLLANHPAIRAAAPTFEGYDLFTDIAFPGGVPFVWFWKRWGEAGRALDQGRLPAEVNWLGRLLVAGVRRVDEDRNGAMLAQAIRDHARNWDVYETAWQACYRGENISYNPNLALDMSSPHAHQDAFRRIGAPLYSYSGWLDGAYSHAAIKRFLTVQTPGSRLTIGPWDHAGIHNVSPTVRKIMDCGEHVAELCKFFDAYLKGTDTGLAAEKPIRYYTMVENAWKTAETWPLPQTQMTAYYLAAGGALSAVKPAQTQGFDTYQVDYAAGTGDMTRWKSLIGGLPTAQMYPDRAERDKKLLVYTSAPLDREMQVTGHPLVRLYISSTAPDGNLFAYLEDVDAQGQVTYVTEGQLRLLHRQLSEQAPLHQDVAPYHTFRREQARLLAAGEVAELIFNLLPTSYLFKAGRSIRVAFAGADKDHFYVPPGAPPMLTFYRNSACPSAIELPVILR